MKKLWEFFNSLKLTVYLVLAMTAVTMYGSIVIYQNQDILGNLDQALYFRWLFTDGVVMLRYTWWMFLLVALVVLFGFNTLVCTIERLPLLVRRYRDPLMNLRDIELGGGRGVEVAADIEGVRRMLEGGRYKVFVEGGQVYAEKNRWLPFIPYVVHLGIMLFLVGHLIGSTWGYRNSGLFIYEGDSVKSPGGDYYLRLDRVKVETRDDGSLKSFGSELTAIKDGREIKNGFVSANTPMFVEGGAVYQREFGKNVRGISLRVAVRSTGYSGAVALGRNADYVEIPGSPYGIKAESFLPDFALDESGHPVSASENPANPALQITLYNGGRPVSDGWLFLRDPAQSTFRDKDVSVSMAGMDVKAFSSFDVNRDPSAILALIASCLVMFGTFVTLYFRRERVWAKVEGGRAQIMCTDDELYERIKQ